MFCDVHVKEGRGENESEREREKESMRETQKKLGQKSMFVLLSVCAHNPTPQLTARPKGPIHYIVCFTVLSYPGYSQ